MDRFHGTGVLTSPDGRKYDGEFRSNVINGKGVLTYKDGRSYDGEFLLGNIMEPVPLPIPMDAIITAILEMAC